VIPDKKENKMITLTVSFNPNDANAEIFAQVVRLLAGIESGQSSATISNDESNTAETKKVKKPRKKRVYTDKQKAEFRAQMVAGREEKEAARKATEEETEESKKVNGSTKLSIPESKAPTPRTGKKVEAKPAAQ
ncbi:MAG TPA: hypothetical protein VLA72_04670, partial [Anaerolineales bacterium]|nr:hypothetical protein [Anaerolineales bacterium]